MALSMNAGWYGLVIVILCMILCVAGVSADQPLLPCEFYGTVTISGSNAPVGSTITALIGGEAHGSFTTTVAGVYGGSGNWDPRLLVNGDASDIGRTISFRVNGNPAGETAVFAAGTTNHLDLRAILNGPPPVASFTRNIGSGPAPLIVQFNDTSNCLDLFSRTWHFGDGTTSGDETPLHTYLAPGTYTVTLTVSNSSGSSITEPGQTIVVYPKGDFNSNGRVDIGDVTTVAYMAAGLIPANPNANFNGDIHPITGAPVIDVADAAMIAWYYVGKILTL